MKTSYILIFLSIFFFGCSKNNAPDNTITASLPTVVTLPISAVTTTTATGGGEVSSDGGATVTARGVCWSTSHNPEATGSHTLNGGGTGVFTSAISALTDHTTYYARAFATNSEGTAYGNEVTFTTGTVVTYDVYVAGYENRNSISVAKLWVNGVATELSNGVDQAEATDLFSSGTDLYVTGYDGFTPIVWKNGVATPLQSTPNNYSYPRAIFVSGNDVYVVGDSGSFTPNLPHGQYWKNGQQVLVPFSPNSSQISTMKDVFVANGIVYIVGTEYFFTPSVPLGGVPVAQLWKNGVATSLSPTDGSIKYGYAWGVFINGTDEYVVGYIRTNADFDSARLWKNGVSIPLQNHGYETKAYSVFVSGNDVYVGGVEVVNSVNKATLWKNGIASTLTGGEFNGNAASVYVTGSDVFVAGNGNSYKTSRWWRNGITTALTDDTNPSRASAIIAR